MGSLVNGKWQTGEAGKAEKSGRFERKPSAIRNWITTDGLAGPTGDSGFRAEPDRYHLYVSLACPWAHRTLIFRHLKGLERWMDLSIVHWKMGDDGWTFEREDGATGDRLYGCKFLHELYTKSDPSYTGSVTVPVLWDKQKRKIVSNESADIIRMFNSAFDDLGAQSGDYYPARLRTEIDALNDRVYQTLNNGVYKAGFAKSQEAYHEAVQPLFETLDWLESRLRENQYLFGTELTEADIRLFTTLVRFDSVYHGHFKCNLKRLIDYPELWRFTRRLYSIPEIKKTINFEHIKNHYYQSHRQINPSGIVPDGPIIEW